MQTPRRCFAGWEEFAVDAETAQTAGRPMTAISPQAFGRLKGRGAHLRLHKELD
jgi:hypothetical protein